MSLVDRHDLSLTGCAPQPLAHYLKALGLFRLVAEQVDPQARAWWQGDRFMLRSTLDETELIRFLAEDYRPTPVLAPWNGGSGFWPKDNSTALEAIMGSASKRMTPYRTALLDAKKILSDLDAGEKLEKDMKETLLRRCRAVLPNAAISWLDAAFILTAGGVKYPPLLGTGGNDGRLDFTNNFMQRLLDVMTMDEGAPRPGSRDWLGHALHGEIIDGLQAGSAIGQFHPGSAGGANASTGFSADSLINPWDYILMIEGALFFAGSSVKRLEASNPDVLSYPFCVRAAGVGYGSSSQQDELDSRAEMWMPLWNRPCGKMELEVLFTEGRVQVAGRGARTGVDFARAIANLGVDRGLSSFQRYGFLVRNGLAYLATPLERRAVSLQPQAELLDEIDDWLRRMRRAATGKEAPASIQRAMRRVESAIMEICSAPGFSGPQALIVALGEYELALARSFNWASKSFAPPAPPLSMRWLKEADDGSAEYRLAASLASLAHPDWGPIRGWISPVKSNVKDGLRQAWLAENREPRLRWQGGTLVDRLGNLLVQRLALSRATGQAAMAERAWRHARLDDVAAFLDGETDDRRLEGLFHGLTLLAWERSFEERQGETRLPSASYALVKLCHQPGSEPEIPTPPEVSRLLLAGRSSEALEAAARRITASLGRPKLHRGRIPASEARRIAAALMFPLSGAQAQSLRRSTLVSTPDDPIIPR